MQPSVLAAILHWNSPDQAVRCVQSLQRSTGVAVQIAVVDNASAHAHYERLVAALPGVTVLRSPDNKGYAGGMNLALRLLEKVPVQHVLLLTQDVVVDPRALGTMVDAMASRQSVGIVGPVVYSLRRAGRVLSAGGYVDVRRVEVGHFQRVVSQAPYEVDWVDGCCMLLSAQVVCAVGGFEEGYFMYYEENDLCQRARRLGWKVVVAPEATVWHEESVVPRPTHYHYMARNAYLYWKRNFGVGFWPVAVRLAASVARHYAASAGSILLPRVRSNAGPRTRLLRAARATTGALLGSLDYLRHRDALANGHLGTHVALRIRAADDGGAPTRGGLGSK